MSVQSEINRIKANVTNAYSAVEEKGGTLPEVQNSDNLADAIKNIPNVGGNETVYTYFTGIQAGSGITSIGDKMTYAVGMRDSANFMTFGNLHSCINATISLNETEVANTAKFTFSLLSDGFALQEPTRITGMTTAYITPNMTYPMQYVITGVENGIKIECEVFAVVSGETPVSFNLNVPMIYIADEADSVSIQTVLDDTIYDAVRAEY